MWVGDEPTERATDALTALLRAQSYGSWLNLYVCTLSINTGTGPQQIPPGQPPEPGC